MVVRTIEPAVRQTYAHTLVQGISFVGYRGVECGRPSEVESTKPMPCTSVEPISWMWSSCEWVPHHTTPYSSASRREALLGVLPRERDPSADYSRCRSVFKKYCYCIIPNFVLFAWAICNSSPFGKRFDIAS